MLSRVVNNIFCYNLKNRDMLRKVMIKIRLERIDIQEKTIVEAFLDSRTISLVISLKFTRK